MLPLWDISISYIPQLNLSLLNMFYKVKFQKYADFLFFYWLMDFVYFEKVLVIANKILSSMKRKGCIRKMY